MGNAQASNSAYLSQYSQVQQSANCSQSIAQKIDGDKVVTGAIDCTGDVNIGTNSNPNAQAKCQNNLTAAIVAKSAMMQGATATAGFLSTSGSKSSNASDTQQAVSQQMQARCSQDINQQIGNESYNIASIKSKGDCNILSNSTVDAKFVCMQQVASNITQQASVKQTAKATSKGITGALWALAAVIIALFVLPEIAVSFLIPKASPDYEGVEITDLEIYCEQLKGQVQALQGKQGA